MSFLFIILQLINIYTFIIFVYVLMSWIPMKQQGVIADIYNALGKICDPYLDLFRRFIPPIGGMVDISPIVAIIALQLVEALIYWIF